MAAICASMRKTRTGRKVVIKLWNGSVTFCEGFDPSAPRRILPTAPLRTAEQIELAKTIKAVDGLGDTTMRMAARRLTFFWGVFCDDYVEIVKDRFWDGTLLEELRASAQATM